MFRTALIPVAALALAACQPEDETAAQAPTDDCGAEARQSMVGEDIAAQDDLEPGDKLRIIEPGMAVTMDFRADRLNVEVDEDGTITKVYCG
ncbi:I78 family peptidase inhibitor [Maritimibacter sp. UBA3975]|uniref:I78 family peptidase inhibitor n=1 Tax=Maritimibacter sp. UBA3975 TaxID=1946833 RepID=UPI000C08E1D4|nr:I78 family peptidase inhibitor [Maritimibacter sp. UBA3975]MAM61987.1 hypothetical protein [Maritimibacter sp.]|tara:strand:- start:1690 stop:1965 length:276 start_codon:yes stop_codon:yes gene_type:complete